MSLWRDEQGNWSSARVLLWLDLTFLSVLVWRDAASDAFNVPSEAYAMLGGIGTFLLLWAAGPRAMQYLGPQVGKAVNAIAAAARKKLDNMRTDDETA